MAVERSQTVPLTDPTIEQINTDVAIRRTDPDAVDLIWPFLDAPPSPELGRYLQNAGILFVVYQ